MSKLENMRKKTKTRSDMSEGSIQGAEESSYSSSSELSQGNLTHCKGKKTLYSSKMFVNEDFLTMRTNEQPKVDAEKDYRGDSLHATLKKIVPIKGQVDGGLDKRFNPNLSMDPNRDQNSKLDKMMDESPIRRDKRPNIDHKLTSC
jgi:hypothetical protein